MFITMAGIVALSAASRSAAKKGTARTVGGDHSIHPSKALEMVPIELPRLGRARFG